MTRSATRVALAAAVGAGWVASIALAQGPAASAAEHRATPRPALRTAYLTHLAGQRFSIRRTATSDTVRAGAGVTDPDIREVWWDASAVPSRDESACTSFQATDKGYRPALLQEGIALRVQRSPLGLGRSPSPRTSTQGPPGTSTSRGGPSRPTGSRPTRGWGTSTWTPP